MDDSYSVQTTAAEATETGGLETLQALKDGDAFLVSDAWGDLKDGPDGLFHSDTRLLSRLVLTVGGARPSRLSSAVSRDNVFFTAHSTNRPLPPIGGHVHPAGIIHLERRRFLRDGRMFERIKASNHGMEDVLLPLAFDFGADFADIFEVRGTKRPQRGELHTPEIDGRRVSFAYTGLDRVRRSTCLSFSEPPARLSNRRAEFMFSLPAGRHVELFLECGPDACAAPDAERWRRMALEARLAMRRKRRSGAWIRSPRNPLFNQWLEQSRADMALLTTDLPTGPYPYAGTPWFSTPFGRDGIISAWQMLWLDPSLARGVLTYLAGRQATETDPFRDSRPGKIMHETRGGEMSALGEVPFGVYYGGVDTTCLFIALAGAYARRTGDLALIRKLWPQLVAASEWMIDYGDSNGDGLIDYQRAADTGLSNQGWKDSEDSIFHADGRFPKGPVALLEVQGYAYAAWLAMCEMGAAIGDARAQAWEERAHEIRFLVEDRFWMEDRGFYAVALDGDGAPCEAIASNAGHLLFSGLPSNARAETVARRLMSSDFRSGWGLRTLATGQPRYNPMSYHNGSVWPHDTAMAVAGIARYGDRHAAALVLGEIHDAANRFQMRLPELFCGFDRRPGEPPIAYPVACLPQAWAAGSVFMMLQAALGVSIDAATMTITVDNPVLPAGVERLSVSRLQVQDASVSLDFVRLGDQIAVLPRDRVGEIRLVTTR
jgi:glycogen debranching enzyme